MFSVHMNSRCCTTNHGLFLFREQENKQAEADVSTGAGETDHRLPLTSAYTAGHTCQERGSSGHMFRPHTEMCWQVRRNRLFFVHQQLFVHQTAVVEHHRLGCARRGRGRRSHLGITKPNYVSECGISRTARRSSAGA